MELFIYILPIILLAAWFLMTFSRSTGNTIRTIDEIIMNLKHYPSDRDKQLLQRVIDNSETSPGEKMLAETLIRMRNRVKGVDAAKLTEFRNDTSAPDKERELADILLRISHQPSSAHHQRLEKLIRI
ncbi:MAG: hypothetical protein COW18_05310 [Zetaproteobacteria bacterium CG12_big_fil_rev_8_21_14_0_65_54_13]|nr:MAG: hypothetical protein COX55_02380 [Zetaproteobacteria bacterium CG23_combo_of_CG06-09_8_20_14_all_54_7]PIW49575.1 MAG: hypothetical protein COW18_05310 [Zetaproteobacteria bacterium CG12_big_fil_rev_8_21_14_0_65_54_13]PIX53354.1 MAG: hypothetical protein COZ50_13735 [Zetaproteobacteria bacterium CG_4_10_14_3_um_filter_54_28]PJA27042.1 MAG: hypothetical protein CO188_13300 [Zetaproteobacteria bacterium CG_4_9_14_3_um_filter_54_145]